MTIKQREVAGIGRAKSRSYRYVAAPLPKVDAYAKVTGRPVKITCTREEVFLTRRGRHPVKMWIKTGVKKDGMLTALHFRSFLDGGA
jgi:CO/xanthine dehydrogenase Mo-binding subunit